MLEVMATGEVDEEVDRSIEDKTEVAQAGHAEDHGVRLVSLRTPEILLKIKKEHFRSYIIMLSIIIKS